MSKPDFDTFLQQGLQECDKEMAPQKDLWPGIEKALVNTSAEESKPTHWRSMSAVAACFAAGIVAFNLVIKPAGEPSQLVAMTDMFEQQKQGLLVQYQSQPALTDNWQAQLAELEEAERAVKQALENEPENPALLKMLAQIYQQQLDLINKVHEPRWQQI